MSAKHAMILVVGRQQLQQMYVHVCGGASSPCCCNYSLKRTAIDNEAQFGPEAAKTLMKNFYVDNLLKSTPDVQSAISLIKAVAKMCRAGGFKLGKFISSNNVVFEVSSGRPKKEGCQMMLIWSDNCLLRQHLEFNGT